MKKLMFFIFVLLIAFSSCTRKSGNGNAEDICDCYDRIHDESVRTDSQEELDAKVQACNLMLSSKLSSLNQKDKVLFMKSFRECQEK